MSSLPPSIRSCRKNGVVLVCYVDGKKVFRAVPDGTDPREITTDSRQGATTPPQSDDAV